ncbi:hypothetical protein T484DRAFT_1815962 [Baffinella frigidus]|nr:hypothetical protein T484DRAFT_1815962 [Cryptophyta sp. CCMP2293]
MGVPAGSLPMALDAATQAALAQQQQQAQAQFQQAQSQQQHQTLLLQLHQFPAKLGRGTQAVVLTKSGVEKMMHLSLSNASKELGLSMTTVKKMCRTLGIDQWNNRSLHKSDCNVTHKHASSRAASQPSLDEWRAFAPPPPSHTREQTSRRPSVPRAANGHEVDTKGASGPRHLPPNAASPDIEGDEDFASIARCC